MAAIQHCRSSQKKILYALKGPFGIYFGQVAVETVASTVAADGDKNREVVACVGAVEGAVEGTVDAAVEATVEGAAVDAVVVENVAADVLDVVDLL